MVTVGDLQRHIGDVSPISRRHMETIAVTSFRCVPVPSPYRPRLISDVGDVVQKMFPFSATVPDVSSSLSRRPVADCYDHMETRLYYLSSSTSIVCLIGFGEVITPTQTCEEQISSKVPEIFLLFSLSWLVL